jgi:hypothetical protein
LATSIIDGVTELCRACGAVIVLEDDLVVGHYFLQFMDRALQRYVGDERVLQVNGYVFPTPLRIPADAFFLPFVGSWGWATWDRSWRLFDPNLGGYGRLMASRQDRRRFDLEGAYPFVRLLERQRAGVVDSWAIRWYLTVFLLGGLALYPRRSLVQNIGLDGTGAHWKARDPAMMGELFTGELVTFPDRVEIDQVGYAAVVAFLRRYSNPLRKALRRIRLRFLC